MANDVVMVRIYLSEADHGRRRTLMQEILTLPAGSTRRSRGGIAGFGASGEVRADDILRFECRSAVGDRVLR